MRNSFESVHAALNSVNRKTFYWLLVVFVCIDALIAILVLRTSTAVREKARTNLDKFQYGSYLSKNEVLRLSKLPVAASGTKLLVAFPNQLSKEFLHTLDYLELLQQTYQERGLIVIAILKVSEAGLIERYSNRLGLTIPLLNDSTGEVADYFGERGTDGGVVLIDDQDTVRVVLPSYLDNHMIRKLVESEMLGYNRVSFLTSELDNQLADPSDVGRLLLIAPNTLSTSTLMDSLSDKPTLLTFVDPMCTNCPSESSRIGTLNLLNEQFGVRLDIILISKSSSLSNELEHYLRDLHFGGRSFMTYQRIFPLNEYCTIPALKKGAVSLLLDKRHSVVFVETMDDDESSIRGRVIRELTHSDN